MRRQRRNRAQRGEDVRYDLEIGFEDSMRGLSVDIQVPRLEECGRCQGKGAEPEDGLVTCPTCRGRGEVIYQQAFLSVRRTCTQCGGRGQIIRRPCKECKGEGYLRRETQAEGQHPGGRRQRHAASSFAGRPAGRQRRPARRSVRGAESRRAPDFRAPRKRPALHRSDQHRAGGAGRVHRYSDLRRIANRENPRRLASRRAIEAEGAGRAASAWQRPRRSVRSPRRARFPPS